MISNFDLVVTKIYEELFNNSKGEVNENDKLYQNGSIALIKLKHWNRIIQLAVDDKRKEIEIKKQSVDKLQLSCENLFYKQAHIQREIRNCQDFFTPELECIEEEFGEKIAATTFKNNLDEINTLAMKKLEDEKQSRIDTEILITDLEMKNKNVIEQLDKKRKFLHDEFPNKVNAISAATLELQTQFNLVNPDNSLVNTIE